MVVVVVVVLVVLVVLVAVKVVMDPSLVPLEPLRAPKMIEVL